MTSDNVVDYSAALQDSLRAKLEDSLHEYMETRRQHTSLNDWLEKQRALYKHWLEQHEGEQLIDGERGFVAFLQEADAPGRDCDLVSLLERDPVLLRQLVVNGCLRVDETAIKRAGSLVGGVERYLMPKGRVTRVQVKEIGK